jgi:hypothetical protein
MLTFYAFKGQLVHMHTIVFTRTQKNTQTYETCLLYNLQKHRNTNNPG